jgi:thymidine kinase
MPLRMRLCPMKSGKTTWLFHILDINSRICECLYVGNVRDDRGGDEAWSTHNPFLNAVVTKNVVYRKVKRLGDISMEEYSKFRVICVDEANFYDDLDLVVIKLLDEFDPDIYVAGLNGSFERKNFGKVSELLPHVEPDEDVVCEYCASEGKKVRAVYNLRLGDEKDEVVTGFDNYAVVCRKCYLRGRGAEAPTADGGLWLRG